MRFLTQGAQGVLVGLSFIATSSHVTANPLRQPAWQTPSPIFENSLEARACAVPCGYNDAYCCLEGQYCYTDNNVAKCGSGSPATSAAPAAPAATAAQQPVTVTVTVAAGNGESSPAAQQCNVQLYQQQCGLTCCNQGQFCNSGTCVDNGATTGGGEYAGQSTITAAIRPTSISTYTVVTSAGFTTTIPYMEPASATGNITVSNTGSSLSGGAIAGIVIGVLAGIIILILIIICCCARGLLDLIRPKRKTEVTEVYESHHHASGAGRPPGRFAGIFGGNAGRRQEEKRSGWLGVAGVLAALAVVLGLKRRHDRREEEKEGTEYTYSDYTYSYSGTSASSASSDRRSRRTRETRSDIRGSRR